MTPRESLSLAILLVSTAARAETVAVLGEEGGVASELGSRGHEASGPAETRALLEARRRATPPDPEIARGLAERGRAVYVEASFHEATANLERAVEAYLAGGLRGITASELARLHLDLGLAYFATGDVDRAQREMTLALRLQPDLAVDLGLHGPPVRRAFVQVREGLARAQAHERTIETDPPGASILVDGLERGESPLTVELPEGTHYVAARLRGRPPAAVRADVSSETTEPISLDLPEADPAWAALEALDAGDLEGAASLAREALDVDAAIAVRGEEGRLRAVRVGREGGTRGAEGATAEELVASLYGVDAAHRALETGTDGEDPGSGGVAWWVWAGGAAVVVAGAVGAAILLTERAGESDRILVPQR